MKAVVQRVKSSSVTVDNEITGQIKEGLMVLLGVEEGDQEADAVFLADKISGLRIFSDEEGKMNLSLEDIGGAMLVVSQFTLLGDCRKGRRPSFTKAAHPELAEDLYEKFMALVKAKGIPVEAGVFGAEMLVSIENDGPVTLIVESIK